MKKRMMMQKYKTLGFCSALATILALSACGGQSAKETLGLTRSAPDEFAVVSRAPLELPPDYALRPPRPGAPRPQEVATTDQAKTTLFGTSSRSNTPIKQAPDSGETALLNQAGAETANPAIRVLVDAEHAAVADDNEPVAKKILGLSLGKDNKEQETLDPSAESKRLRARNNDTEAGVE